MSNYRAAANDDIEVSVDLTQSDALVVWRKADSDEDEWNSTPFCSADVRDEFDALQKVDLWLETSYGN